MIPTMMDSKVFEKIFDAWNLATVASTVWGPDSDMAKNAQSAFYSILFLILLMMILSWNFLKGLKESRLGQKDKIQVDHK